MLQCFLYPFLYHMFADQARLGSTLCCNAFHTHFSIIYMFDDQVRLGQALCCNAFYNHIRLWGSVFTIGGHHNIRYPPRKYFRFSTKNLGPKPPTFITIEEIWVLRKSKIIQTGLVLISVLDFYHWWSPQYQVPTEKILVVTTICDTHRDNILGYKACLNNFAFSQHPNFFNAYLGWVFWSQIFC